MDCRGYLPRAARGDDWRGGRLVGLQVAVGLLAGVTLQRLLAKRNKGEATVPGPAVAGP
jgi:hypothetical protein